MKQVLVCCFFGVVVVGLCSALVDHDAWEFIGGKRKRVRHGLNLAAAEIAPRRGDSVRFDGPVPETKTQLLVTNDEAPPAPLVQPSNHMSNDRVKAKQNLLLLPMASTLEFDHVNSEDLDASSFWGRLYVRGFPDSIQYFRSHFGLPVPTGQHMKLKLATPLNMCDASGSPALHNADDIDNKTILVAMRGVCTFGEKATVAYASGAAGVLFINNEDGLMHPSGPEARDVQLSASIITQDDGNNLIHALRRVAEKKDPNHSLQGRFVPMICSKSGHEYCEPINTADKSYETSLDYTGQLKFPETVDHRDVIEYEYVQADFGAWLDPLADFSILLPNVIGGDSHCCDASGFKGEYVDNTTAMMCLRGECPFVEKAENVAAAGAGILIVSSHNETITRMGADPRSRGRRVSVAAIMVGKEAHDDLVSNFYYQLDDGKQSIIKLLAKEDYTCVDENNEDLFDP